MKNIIKNWTAKKNTLEFDYITATNLFRKNKILHSKSIYDYLHIDLSISDFTDKINGIDNLKSEYIENILELVNIYTYYIKMNNLLTQYEESKNIKKLEQLNKILDDEFIDFLDRNLYLDKTILSSDSSLKIKDNHQNVIKYYLQHDLNFAINILKDFFDTNKKSKNSLSVKDDELTNNILLKPKIKSYLQPMSERAICKCLYFDLLYNFEELTKDQSIFIVKEFFNIELHSSKIEHTLKKDTIKLIKDNKDNLDNLIHKSYKIKFTNKKQIIKKKISPEIDEIKQIFNLKKQIKENFIPLLYWT